MIYFVTYLSNQPDNWHKDGCEYFFSYNYAADFARRMVLDDFECHIYEGKSVKPEFQIGKQTT